MTLSAPVGCEVCRTGVGDVRDLGSQCLGRDSGHRGRDVWVPGFRGRLRLRFWNASAAGSSLQAEVLTPHHHLEGDASEAVALRRPGLAPPLTTTSPRSVRAEGV